MKRVTLILDKATLCNSSELNSLAQTIQLQAFTWVMVLPIYQERLYSIPQYSIKNGDNISIIPTFMTKIKPQEEKFGLNNSGVVAMA